MSNVAKLKIDINAVGLGSVTLDGVDISNSLSSICFKTKAGEPSEVALTIFADVDAEITTLCDRVALAKSSIEPMARTVRLADGREVKVRERQAS